MAVPQSILGGNTPKQMVGLGQGPKQPNLNIMTPEEKMLRKERRRVESLIAGYNNNPSRYDNAYVLQLEQMANQYQIPFQRADAGVIRNAGAAVGGFIDSFLWDLVPDSWYSSDATATARKMGKGAGLASAALLTGGTSLLGRGMTKLATTGIGKYTTAGAALGAKKMLAPAIAGTAKQGGMLGGLAEGYLATGQGRNVATMAVDDIATKATRMANKGNKKQALEQIDKAGDLLSPKEKLKMAQNTGSVGSKLESDVYSSIIGAGGSSVKGGTKTEVLLNSILGKEKGVGPKTKTAIDNILKDKNKVRDLEKILNDPNTDIDMAVNVIKDMLPKSVRSKVVSKSDMIKLLSEFYGFSSIGG